MILPLHWWAGMAEFPVGFSGGHMQVSLVNDGPVTILLDSSRIF
jgi:D-Tyr-tRNAtyr deacylase